MTAFSLHLGLNYPNSSSQLYGCVNDAKDLAAACKPLCKSTVTLLDNKADRAGAHKAVASLLGKLESGDVGIITLSSHGTREKISGVWHEAIVWADFELTYDSELDALLSKRAKGSSLLLLGDLCHGGGLSRSMKRPRFINASRTQSHKFETAPRRRLTYLYWGGCKDNEYCYDANFDGRGNGAFTYYTLQALKQKPATFNDWFKLVRGDLPSSEYPQSPIQRGSMDLRKRKVPT